MCNIQQAQIRVLASELLLAKERERRRIATGVHDQIGQLLAMAKIKLDALLISDVSDVVMEPLKDIRDALDQAISESRSLTFELGSSVLYVLGLEAGLESLGEQMHEQHGIDFFFSNDDAPKPLTDRTRLALYCMARELLFNVIKHAQADVVTIALSRADDELRLVLEDDGKGFDVSGVGDNWCHTGGFGLFSIQQQIAELGGRIEIDSVPNQGTCVTIAIPIESTCSTP